MIKRLVKKYMNKHGFFAKKADHVQCVKIGIETIEGYLDGKGQFENGGYYLHVSYIPELIKFLQDNIEVS